MSRIALLSQSLVEKHGVPQGKAIEFVSAMFAIIRERILTDRIVKVKGLGTFKLAEMNSRESVDVNTGERITIEGRFKLSFTPENAVRDRINSPFIQFESIEMDDDIDFTAIDKVYEEQEPDPTASATPQPEIPEPETNSEPEPEDNPAPSSIEPEPEPSSEPLTATEEPAEAPSPTLTPVEEEPAPTPAPTKDVEEEAVPNPAPAEEEPAPESADDEPVPLSTKEEPASEPKEMRSPYCENLIREEIDHSHKIITMLKWLIGLVIAMLVCLGVTFVYHLWFSPISHPFVLPEKVILLDETEEGDTQDVFIDSLGFRTVVPKAAEQEAKPTESEKQPAETEPQPAQTEKLPTETPGIPNQDELNKDARIRTGAYAILGLDTVVTVQEGQTFRGICRAYLGEGMECYVEAVNGGITTVEPGQKLRIPKVKLKKLLNKK